MQKNYHTSQNNVDTQVKIDQEYEKMNVKIIENRLKIRKKKCKKWKNIDQKSQKNVVRWEKIDLKYEKKNVK